MPALRQRSFSLSPQGRLAAYPPSDVFPEKLIPLKAQNSPVITGRLLSIASMGLGAWISVVLLSLTALPLLYCLYSYH